MKQASLWENKRLRLDQAIDLSIETMQNIALQYKHWVVAYSGGKDSSALVAFVLWAIETGKIDKPEKLTVLYADTRQEYEALHQTAMSMLALVEDKGYVGRRVLPAMDERFYVYMFGKGVTPPKSRFRWCTERLKVKPMLAAIEDEAKASGEPVLQLIGLRKGESAMRDASMAVACGRDDGECGTGHYYIAKSKAIAHKLSPIVHWRTCHIWDWLFFGEHGYDALRNIALVYGDGDENTTVRTGCVGCNLVEHDRPLGYLVSQPEWSHLAPLQEIKPLFKEMLKPSNRLRKNGEWRKDGTPFAKQQRLGPMTMEARQYFLAQILSIQERAKVDLINNEELTRIYQLWETDPYPERWDGSEVTGEVMLDNLVYAGNLIHVQPLLPLEWNR